MPTNKTVITVITGTVCILALLSVATYCVLAFRGTEPSQGFSLLTGGLVGSLTSMLVKTTPTEANKPADAPTPVTVVNKPKDPVPVIEK